MTLRTSLLSLALVASTPMVAHAEDPALETRAEQRYRHADRLSSRSQALEAAVAYHEAGQLFLDATDGARITLPPNRLHRRALSALRRAALHVPAARSQLEQLCARLATEAAGLVALPSACNLPPPPPPAPPAPPEPQATPAFVTPPEPVIAPPPARETHPVSLSVLPSRAARVGIDVQWNDDIRSERLVGSAGTWQMPAGAHAVHVRAPGFVSMSTAIIVGPREPLVTLRLRRARPARVRIALSAAFAGVGAVMLTTGAALTADGRRSLDRTEQMFPDIDPAKATRYFAHAADVRSQHLALLGAGSGALLAVPAAAAGSVKVSAFSMVLGAVALGVGTGVLVSSRRRSDRLLDATTPHSAEFYADLRQPQLVAAAILGGGATLLAGSLTALVTQVALEQRRTPLDVRPQVGTNQWALQLAGRF